MFLPQLEKTGFQRHLKKMVTFQSDLRTFVNDVSQFKKICVQKMMFRWDFLTCHVSSVSSSVSSSRGVSGHESSDGKPF
jgi:hypothetical protein